MNLRPVSRFRVVCFDLENRPSAYWYDGAATSEITAFGWKWDTSDAVETMMLLPSGRFDVGTHNSKPADHAYRTFRKVLTDAGLVYGHNIRQHDLSMFNAGLLRKQLPPLGRLLTSDTLKDIPKRGGMSASLEALADMYGLDGEKQRMSPPMWEKANQLTGDGVALAWRRVITDVLLQEQLRAALLERGLLGSPKNWYPRSRT